MPSKLQRHDPETGDLDRYVGEEYELDGRTVLQITDALEPRAWIQSNVSVAVRR